MNSKRSKSDIISFLYLMKDGASTEVAVVGNEGLVGVAFFTGAEKTRGRVVVQSAGSAYRMVGKQFKDEFHQHANCLSIHGFFLFIPH